MNLERLKKEIEHQRRNGRENMYIRLADIVELTNERIVESEKRIFINIDSLEELIDKYEENHNFRNSLKVPEGKLKPIDKEGKGYYFIPKKNNKER